MWYDWSNRKDSVYNWINNGNITDRGTQLDDEFVELVKYISDMRKWLGTNNLIFKIQGGQLVRNNEKAMIDKAWRQLDKIANKATNKAYTRPAMNSAKPAAPQAVNAIAVEDIEL